MPTVDQRDLSQINYDYALDMYRQRAREKAAKSQGLDRFLYDLFGSDLIGSVACAMDPWARFRFSRYPIASVQRFRKFRTVNSAKRQVLHKWYDVTSYDGNYTVDYSNSSTTSSPGSGISDCETQGAIYGFCWDTTKRTRGANAELGEYELFVPHFSSSGFSYEYTGEAYTWTTISAGYYQRYSGKTTYSNARIGPAFIMPTYLITNSDCNARALKAMKKNSLGLVSKSLPTSRRFNLAYQIGELKDIPQLLSTSVRAFRDFEAVVGVNNFRKLLNSKSAWDDKAKRLLKDHASSMRLSGLDSDLSNAYLCFKFGWESIVQAVQGVVQKPAQVANDVNRLIARNGLATTFRSNMRWTEKWDSPPCAYLDYLTGETRESSPSASGTLGCELRCMVNATFEFPTLDVPRLRQQLWVRKLGADPTPSDIYDLVPWTWLIDWFNGIGEYIHVMNALFEDKSLINYGFVTYEEQATSTTTATISYTSSGWKSIDQVRDSWNQKNSMSPSATYYHKYVLRKSLASVAAIKTPANESSLSSTQKLILGALFGSKNNIAAKRS